METYLHLYLGATIFYPETKEVSTVDWTHILDAKSAVETGGQFKPSYLLALYPIGRMPPKTRAEYDKVRSENYAIDPVEDAVRTHAEITGLLIRNRVDVFDLIKKGLAVNITSIKQFLNNPRQL